MKFRLFLAIDLPSEIKTHIESLQNKLNSLGLPVTWETPEKMHMSLNFLGSVEEKLVHHIAKSVDAQISKFQPFTLIPQFLETMYKRHEPSLIYLGIGGEVGVLKGLQKAIRDQLNDLEIPQDLKFLPHITVGRLKRTDPTTTKQFLDRIDAVEFKPLPEFTVSELTMYRSFVSSRGSHFAKLASFLLE